MKTKGVLVFLAMVGLCFSAARPAPSRGQEPASPVRAEQDPAPQGKFRKVENAIPQRYIVVLNDDHAELKDPAGPGDRPSDPNNELTRQRDEIGRRVEAKAIDLARAHNGIIEHVYKYSIKGFSAEMSEAEAMALSQDPQVKYVEEDGEVYLDTIQNNAPWGIDRIDQRDLPLRNTFRYELTGQGVQVYVLDSGIRTTHQEFGGRATRDADFINDGQNGNDCRGHGTHVAGIIGGNTFGVVKNVRLHSVRVFACAGPSSDSIVIAGIDWVTRNHRKPAVANMSLSGPASSAIDDAVRRSIAAGVTCVVSAGNSNRDAGNESPARVREAITAGATDNTDTRAAFSNFGSVVDVFAPGVNIISAGITSDTATRLASGTSMAAPHVTGVVAQFLQMDLYSRRVPHSAPVRAAVLIMLRATTGKVINPGPGSPNRLLYAYPPKTAFDFDGDDKTDIAVWRPSNGNGIWYIHPSTGIHWGQSGDVPVPADYDGDRMTDIAYWRPSDGNWDIRESSVFDLGIVQWGRGQFRDVPVPADYDGDLKADIAVWRPSDGPDGYSYWYILPSTGGRTDIQWGEDGDVPVPADYDGDGKTDLAVWRPSNGMWYILQSRDGRTDIQWGQSGDVPLPGDYNGDGKTDILVWRPSDSKWYFQFNGVGLPCANCQSGDVPVPADYDGDGQTNVFSVWRPLGGNWYNIPGVPNPFQWGQFGDVPIPAAWRYRVGSPLR